MISLLVGLGNIGDRYRGTRHNLGFEVVEKIWRDLKLSPKLPTADYVWVIGERNRRPLVLAWPGTYMNRSGVAVHALLQVNALEPSQMLVIVDDFNLPLGKIRLRPSGSDGGHHGLASVIEALETDQFPRLRLGIGPLPEGADTVDFVLSRFADEDFEAAGQMIAVAAEAALFTVEHRLQEAMSKYNINPA
ncbi:MAG: aminoacyl-tRNA hydrolase [bacterium]